MKLLISETDKDMILSNNPKTENEWADFWFYFIGANIIPADTKNKATHIIWSQWQDKPIPEEQFKEWKDGNKFSGGMAVICGQLWRGKYRGKYIGAIDADNLKAIQE